MRHGSGRCGQTGWLSQSARVHADTLLAAVVVHAVAAHILVERAERRAVLAGAPVAVGRVVDGILARGLGQPLEGVGDPQFARRLRRERAQRGHHEHSGAASVATSLDIVAGHREGGEGKLHRLDPPVVPYHAAARTGVERGPFSSVGPDSSCSNGARGAESGTHCELMRAIRSVMALAADWLPPQHPAAAASSSSASLDIILIATPRPVFCSISTSNGLMCAYR